MMGTQKHDDLVSQLVAATGFEEKDRPWLDALTDGILQKFAAHCAPTHARMPGMVFGTAAAQPEPRAHRAHTERRGLTANHSWMPSIAIGS